MANVKSFLMLTIDTFRNIILSVLFDIHSHSDNDTPHYGELAAFRNITNISYMKRSQNTNRHKTAPLKQTIEYHS